MNTNLIQRFHGYNINEQLMIEEWFPTPIFYTDLKDTNNDVLIKRAYDLKEITSDVKTEWHCDTFNTLNKEYLLGNEDDKVVTDLIETTGQHVFRFAKEFGLTVDYYDLICKDFWFNISEPGDYQEFHQHPNNHISAVYYVQSSENSGDIIFKNPESIGDMYQIPNEIDTKFSYKTARYNPVESRLLIFKSNLLHMVEKNKSNRDRISIAMNFYFVRKPK